MALEEVATTKRCGRCGAIKSVSEFYEDRRCKRDGLQGRCKPCQLIGNAESHRRGSRRNPKEWWARRWTSSKRGRHHRAGIAHDLTADYLISIAPDICPVFGTRLIYGYGTGRSRWSPSVDRVVPELGYIPGNIIVVSEFANRIKQDATPEEVAKVAAFYWFHMHGSAGQSSAAPPLP